MGLWVSPDRLVQVRRNRLTSMGESRDSDYVDLDAVRAEIAATRQLFENQGWPMIDVVAPLDRGNGGGGDEPAGRAQGSKRDELWCWLPAAPAARRC